MVIKMSLLKKILNKQITHKFLWTSILITILFFLRILDISLTLIALNLNGGYGFREANPLAYVFVKNPEIWIAMNFIMIAGFGLMNVILWFMDKKTEVLVDKVTIIFDIMLLITVILNIWVVLNNMILFYKVLGG